MKIFLHFRKKNLHFLKQNYVVMKTKEVINFILNELEIDNMSKFARDIGVNRQRIIDLKSGKILKMPYDVAEGILSRYPQYSRSWLLSGEGSPYSEEVAEAGPQGIPLVPVSAMAGALTGELPAVTERECERYSVPKFERADFLITVSGDSMFPKFQSGDIVACRRVPLGSFFQWHRVYVVDSEQGVLIKRVEHGSVEDSVTLVSENRDYSPIEIKREEIYSLALVVGLIRAE